MKEIKVEYDGCYPNLCAGGLIVYIDGKRWEFPEHCLMSGGSVCIDDEGMEEVEQGPWRMDNWPKDFPEELKNDVLEEINEVIPEGCCGGCV